MLQRILYIYINILYIYTIWSVIYIFVYPVIHKDAFITATERREMLCSSVGTVFFVFYVFYPWLVAMKLAIKLLLLFSVYPVVHTEGLITAKDSGSTLELELLQVLVFFVKNL